MDEETSPGELLRDMLWSRTRATRIRRWHHPRGLDPGSRTR